MTAQTDFSHAECAALAALLVSMPEGLPMPILVTKGLPDFEVSPKDARAAFNHLRRDGFVRKTGAFLRLTETGRRLMVSVGAVELVEEIRREVIAEMETARARSTA